MSWLVVHDRGAQVAINLDHVMVIERWPGNAGVLLSTGKEIHVTELHELKQVDQAIAEVRNPLRMVTPKGDVSNVPDN